MFNMKSIAPLVAAPAPHHPQRNARTFRRRLQILGRLLLLALLLAYLATRLTAA